MPTPNQPSYQQKLAWALEENPALLTGDGHLAPLRAIPRFIELLDDAGVTGVVRPACGRCRRVVHVFPDVAREAAEERAAIVPRQLRTG